MSIHHDIAVILYCSDQKVLQKAKYDQLKKKFSELVVAAHGGKSCDASLATVRQDAEIPRTELLNKALEKVSKGWVLLLEADENLNIEQFDDFTPEDGFVYKAAIKLITAESTERIHYQLRLLPIKESLQFQGGHIPHSNTFLKKQECTIHEDYILIRKGGVMHKAAIVSDETEHHSLHAEAWLLKGLILAGEGKHKEAEKCFRTCLQINQLPDFDQAAAYNGLADALFEQNKWHDCRKIAKQSITLIPQQRMPYLILFRSSFASNQWEDAYNYLFQYLEILAKGTQVNHDVVFPLEDTHFLLGEAAYKQGWHQKALVHYEQFYELKKGDVGSEIIQRLLIYALEIGEQKNAETYFDKLYAKKLPKDLTDTERTKVLEFLTLFVDKEWYDLPLRVYEQLFNHDSSDPLVLRRWVASLIKARQIKKAQNLLSKHKTTFS